MSTESIEKPPLSDSSPNSSLTSPPPTLKEGALDKTDTEVNLLVKSPPSLKTPSSTLTGNCRVSAKTHGTKGNASTFLFMGAAQMALGVLMAVFGVLALVHEAALSAAGGGLWGGAVAMGAGVTGVLAGLRSCYSGRGNASPIAVTAFLAMCLISLAVSNLVLVLACTGLVRDSHRNDPGVEDGQDSEDSEVKIEEGAAMNWAPILANCGLLLASLAHCVIAIVSTLRSYKQVCPCARRRGPEKPPLGPQQYGSGYWPESPESAGSFYSTSSKEMLISNWLGQQHHSVPSPARHPNMVLITQPPVQGPCGPIFTLPSPPPVHPPTMIGYQLPNAPFLNPLLPPQYIVSGPPSNLYAHHGLNHCRKVHRPRHQQPHAPREKKRRRRSAASQQSHHPVTEEEVAKTYTGLDREIAEEFIATTMDSGIAKTHHTCSAPEAAR